MQARMWEQHGEYARAVDFYLQVKDNNCSNKQILVESWEKVCANANGGKDNVYFVSNMFCVCVM